MTALARERRLTRQLPDVAAELARLVAAGATLHLAFADLAESAPPPVGVELERLVGDLRRGLLLDRALLRWVERSQRSDVRLLVSACRLGLSEGGNLVAALEGVAAALDDERELAGETRALTAQARASAHVMTTLPLAGLLLFTVFDRSVVAYLLTTPVGLALLVSGLLLNALGALALVALIRWALR